MDERTNETLKTVAAMLTLREDIHDISFYISKLMRLMGETWILDSDFGTKKELHELYELFNDVAKPSKEISRVLKEAGKFLESRDTIKLGISTGELTAYLKELEEKRAKFYKYIYELSSKYREEMLGKKELK